MFGHSGLVQGQWGIVQFPPLDLIPFLDAHRRHMIREYIAVPVGLHSVPLDPLLFVISFASESGIVRKVSKLNLAKTL